MGRPEVGTAGGPGGPETPPFVAAGRGRGAAEEEGEGEVVRDGVAAEVDDVGTEGDAAGFEGAAVDDEGLGSAVGPLSAPYATGTAPTTSQHTTTGPMARVRVPRSPGVTG
ncbi:hypothetical protein ACFC0D_13475 [Streptomyces sp. NPDC056222]|uniref:hypothetical protein n=1 Tax=Streptomyces sp. NPDC056222 TaxID=3345749 RepID=UPI0035E09055